MIIAVPVAEQVWLTPMGREQDGHQEQIVWWHWECTRCGEQSRPRARFSHAASALAMGGHHLRESCIGVQLELFALVGGSR